MVAFWAHNPLVVGSIPIPATTKNICKNIWKYENIFGSLQSY